MPKFKVYGGHDAYAVFSTVVEADSEDEARQYAIDNRRDLNWKNEDETTIFDHFDVFTEEGSVVELEPEVPFEERVEAASKIYQENLAKRGMTSDDHLKIIESGRSGHIVELTSRERDVILAALRLWQRLLEEPNEFIIGERYSDLMEIATNNGSHNGLTAKDLDELCAELNQ